MKRLFVVLAVTLSLLSLPSGCDALFQPQSVLFVRIDMDPPMSLSASYLGTKMIPPETTAVFVELRRPPRYLPQAIIPGELIAETVAVFQYDASLGRYAEAKLSGVPMGIDAVLSAFIKDGSSNIIFRADESIIVSATRVLPPLVLMPTVLYSSLFTLIPGSTALISPSLASKTSVIFKFELDDSFVDRATKLSFYQMSSPILAGMRDANGGSLPCVVTMGGSITFTPRVAGTLYAVCYNDTANSFMMETSRVPVRVYYEGNGNTGGTAPVDSSPYYSGNTPTTQNWGTLVRAGYRFLNWNIEPDGSGTGYNVGATLPALGTSNVVLYAQWVPLG